VDELQAQGGHEQGENQASAPPPPPPPDNPKANADLSPAPRWRLFARRPLTIVLALVAGLVVASAAGIAYATYDYARDYDGEMLPGTVIAGVDVSGLTYDEALAAVEAAVAPQLDRTVRLTYEGKTWETTPRELGARSTAEKLVREALDLSEETTFFKMMRMRVLGEGLGFERDVVIVYPRAGVRSFVDGVAEGFDRPARDAAIDYSTGWVEFIEAREGREVKRAKTRRALLQTLRAGGDEVELAVKTTAPEETGERFDQVLLVRIGENKLYLYEDGEITHEWVVATGQPEYMTPTGLFEVTEKRYMPTWVNPAPDTWGADLPASIPPGPGNPLGVRALNWSAPGIRFHGTSALYSLGYNASHGCVRLSNEDVIELYDLVEVGTPIVSVVAGPLKPLYTSTPDPIVVPGDDDAEADEVQRQNARGERSAERRAAERQG
jgi:lipoprotein-anchoring transpeptidase ErfK/SrfK